MPSHPAVVKDAERRRGRGRIAVPGVANSLAGHAFSAALAAVTVAATASTVFGADVLHGPPVMAGSARGTALTMLVLAVPLLLVGQATTLLGSRRGLAVWLGSLAYLLYNAFMLLFGTPFNSVFLLYVATLSLALWSVVAVVRAVDTGELGRRIAAGTPRRAIAIFCWVLVALNTAAWLSRIVPGLTDSSTPAFLAGTGLTTLPNYVQDLAVWLPLMSVAAMWLWRDSGWGHLVVASLLMMWVLESISIAADQYLGAVADPASTVASAAMAPVFVGVGAVTAVPLLAMLRRW